MRKTLSALFILGTSSLAFGHVQGAGRQAVEKASAKLVTAMKDNDVDSLKNLVSSDFILTENGKTYNKAQWLTGAEQTMKAAKFTTTTHVVLSCHMSKDEAKLKTRTTAAGTLTVPGKKAQSISIVSEDEEIWVKKGGSWKLKKDVTIKESTKYDGKDYPSPS